MVENYGKILSTLFLREEKYSRFLILVLLYF